MTKSDIKNFQVLVDSREPDKAGNNYISTFSLVRQYFPNAKKEQLVIGDIGYKSIRIELKSMNDMISTITSPRFRNQLYNFALTTYNQELQGYYFIHGDWNDINKYSRININAILGAIASIQARYGLRIGIFPNKEYCIYCACKIIEKTFDGKSIVPKTFKTLTEDRCVNTVAQTAERLSERAIINALRKFRNVRGVINATQKELEEVEFIGKKLAGRMIETFTFDYSEKGDFDDEIDAILNEVERGK